MSPRVHILSARCLILPPPPSPIPEPRSKAQEPPPNIRPHPLNDIQILVRNSSSNPGARNSVLEPRLLAKLLAKSRRLTLSYILLSC